jgi:exodeoxyribonuclease VII large subunit
MNELHAGFRELFGSGEPLNKTHGEQAPVGRAIMSVSELVGQARQLVEGGLRKVAVVGEIRAFKAWRSGHFYFDLKDNQSVLSAVMFKPLAAKVPFALEDGMQVILTGRMSVYVPMSKMQLIVEAIEPAGQGQLALAFEQMKKRLEAEGLFDVRHKKPLPLCPKRIGIVSSPQGAALQDMLRVLHQRMPRVSVLLAATRVQGEGAADEIAAAIQRLDSSGLCDVIIVGRGGGQLEHLWCFNEEPVARAIFASKTPIVSAVGHETDTTIADFVADVRAATPTHAATQVVPDEAETLRNLHLCANRLYQHWRSRHQRAELSLTRLSNRMPDLRLFVLGALQRLDAAERRSREALLFQMRLASKAFGAAVQRLEASHPRAQLAVKLKRLHDLTAQLQSKLPTNKIRSLASHLLLMQKALDDRAKRQMRLAKERLLGAISKLEAMSPLAVLARGYALVTRVNGDDDTADGTNNSPAANQLVTSVRSLLPGSLINVRLRDGTIKSTIVQIDGEHNK